MTVELLAPAKINLGLEILGKRDDGYHDIATVFQTISLFDRIRLDEADADSVHMPGPAIEENLAARVLEFAGSSGISRPPYRVSIEKRIPIAAGLGGASTDAAAMLAAMQTLHGLDSRHASAIALRLGSDVPFLLRGGAAFATGRGEVLEPLPSLRSCWFALVIPRIAIERKTAQLYGALTDADFTSGHRVERVTAACRRNRLPAAGDLANAFDRPLADFVPGTASLVAAFTEAGAPFVALSGAGPAHYTIVRNLSQAIDIARRIVHLAPMPVRALVARPVSTGIQIRDRKTLDASGAL